MHGADVTQSTHVLLNSPALEVSAEEKYLISSKKNIFCCSVRVHAAGGDVRHLRRGHPRRGPPGPHQPVPDQQQLGAGHHVRLGAANVLVIVK